MFPCTYKVNGTEYQQLQLVGAALNGDAATTTTGMTQIHFFQACLASITSFTVANDLTSHNKVIEEILIKGCQNNATPIGYP